METLKTLHKKYIELDRLVKYLYANQGAGGGDVGSDPIWTAAGDLAVGSGSSTATTLSLGAAYSTLTVNATATGIEWIAPGAPAQADVDMNGFNVNNLDTVTFQGGQGISWNSTYHLIQVPTGDGAIHKLGMDTMFDVHNATGTLIEKGEVIYPTGTSTNGVSNVDRAIANTHETISGPIGFAAADIPNGTTGHVMVEGVLDPMDTSGLSEGPAYLSASIAGALTSVKPVFPNYDVLIGIVDKVGVSDGVLTVDSSHSVKDTLFGAWDGGVREGFDFLVTSDGATITGSLERTGGGNLTMLFAEGFVTLDCTPAQTIVLTPGTDTVPQPNYIYIPASTKVLTVSTSGFPLYIEHIKIADVLVQSASKVQVQGPLVNRNWNDHVKTTGDNGHLLHLSERLRQNPASWLTGAAGSSVVDSPTASNVYVAVTGGQVYQLHRQDFPAVDLQTGGDVHIVNHSTTPYIDVTNLNTQTADSTGASLTNKSFSFVLWGVQNKGGQHCPIMINLPKGSYARTNPDAAVSDVEGFAVYDIPDAFRGKGFLIARFTYQLASNGTDWILYDTEDLRGKVPNSTAGASSGGGAGVTEFTGLTDTPVSYAGQGLKGVRVASGEAALEFFDGIEKIGTPANDQIGIWTGDGTIEGQSSAVILGTGGGIGSNVSLRLGSNDSISANLYLYGNASTTGGTIYLYNGGGSDTVDDRYDINAAGGVFTIRAHPTADFLTYTSATSQLALPMYGGGTITGTPTYALAVDVSGNIIESALPSVTKVGTPADNQIAIWTGDGTIEGNENVVMSGSSLILGKDETTSSYGIINLRGSNSVSGGSLIIYHGETRDSFEGSWRFEASSTNSVFKITGGFSGDWMFLDGQNSQIEFYKALTSNQSIANIDATGNTALTTKEYVDTAVAGAGYGDVFASGTPVANQIASWSGSNTIVGEAGLRETTSGSSTNLYIGEANTRYGHLYLEGSSTTPGGWIRMVNGVSRRTDAVGYDILADGDFVITTLDQSNFFRFEADTRKVRFPDYGGGTKTGTETYLAAWDTNGDFVEAPLITSGNGIDVTSGVVSLGGAGSITSNVNLRSQNGSTIIIESDKLPDGNDYAYMDANTTGNPWATLGTGFASVGAGTYADFFSQSAETYSTVQMYAFSPGSVNFMGLDFITNVSMLVTDQVNTKGLEYAADYSANFTARSLVDKAYVDAQSSASPLTTKGDIYVYSTVDTRLPVSGNNGWVLSEDSTEPTGLKWIALGGGGDMVLAAAQDVTGLKTFDPATLGVRNVADTFTTTFTSLATAARSVTLPDHDGVLLTYTGANAAVDFNTQAVTAGTYNGLEIDTTGGVSIGTSIIANDAESIFLGPDVAYNGLGSMTNNIAIGSYTLGGGGQTWSDVQESVLIGSYAGLTKEKGDYCIVIGYNANDQGGGDNNIIIGNDAGYETPGYDNVSIGSSAGRNQYGNWNVAIGSQTMYSGNDEEGSYNVAIGYWANAALPATALDGGAAQTVPAANVANGGSTVTITAHGFGEIGQVMSFQLSTDGTLPTGYSPGIDYLFEIVNANTIRALVNQRRGPDTFTDQGTGNHTFTPYTKTNNAIAIGKNANNTKSNQVMLGGAEITETVLRGAVINDTTYNGLKIDNPISSVVAIGSSTTGDSIGGGSIAIGQGAGAGGGGNDSILIGQGVGESGDIGSSNTIIGAYAVNTLSKGSLTSVNNNLIMGFNAADDFRGNNNVFLGEWCAPYSQGDYNVMIGNNPGRDNLQSVGITIGDRSGRYQQGFGNIILGSNSLNDARGVTTETPVVTASTNVNVSTNRITFTAHGLGPNYTRFYCTITTDGTKPGGLEGTGLSAEVYNANELRFFDSGGDLIDITTQGTGNHTVTPETYFINTVVIGNDVTWASGLVDKSNQVVIGDTAIVETKLNGEINVQDNSVGFTLQTYTGTVATTDINWKNGNKAKFTFGAGNETLTFTNPSKPASFQLIVVQDGVGGRTITWPTILWQGGAAPTLSTGIGAIDIVSFMYDGTNWYGSAALDFS